MSAGGRGLSPNGSGRPADDRVPVGGPAERRRRAVLPLVGGQEPQAGDFIRQGLPVNTQEELLSSRTMWSLRGGHVLHKYVQTVIIIIKARHFG